MIFFASKAHDKLNGEPFNPEVFHRNICLNPLYFTRVMNENNNVNILLDSGAFQDVRTKQRLSFQEALNRQLNFEKKADFTSSLIVSYDRLVDEKYDKDLGQIKERVSYTTAERYVEETINAAKFLVDNRKELRGKRLVISNQGVCVSQYVDCIKEILKFSEKKDIIAFGGFCIIGLKPKYEPQYYEVLKKSLPLIQKKGIKRIHVFGVGKFRPLVKTQLLCRKYHIEPSYDTSAYEVNGIMGSVFNPYATLPEKKHLAQIFWKDEKFSEYHPAKLAQLNIKLISNFWEEFNKTKLV